MKTLFKIVGLLIASVVLFASCDLDDSDSPGGYNSNNSFWLGYANVRLHEGTTTDSRSSFDLILDDETVMKIAINNVVFEPGYVLKDDTRVIANFTILEESTSGGVKQYVIQLNAMKEVLSKKPVYSSRVDEAEIGNDPVDVESTGFGGRYFNINFSIWHADTEVKHFINLWVNEEHPDADEDNVYVELRHNAYGEMMIEQGNGRVSFDISEFIPEGKGRVNVHLTYKDYQGRTNKYSGVYHRKNIPSGTGEVYSYRKEIGNVY